MHSIIRLTRAPHGAIAAFIARVDHCLFTGIIGIASVAAAAGIEPVAPLTIEVRPNDINVVKWVAKIGNEGGTPVVSNDCVLVGTDNGQPRLQKETMNAGAVMCFDRGTGQFRWQILHARLPASTSDMRNALFTEPAIKNGRVYYQNNRGEVICAPLAGDMRRKSTKVVWKLDFINQLKVFKRDAIVNPVPSPLVDGDRVYCVTGNGSIHGDENVPEMRSFVPNPDAPSFVAMDANTGNMLWQNSAPGKSICYGQWGSPAKLVVGKTDAILFPGGDGFLYALAPETGRILAKVNLNEPGTKAWSYHQRGDVAFCSQRPLVKDHMIYLGLGQDQDMPVGKRFPIICIDGKELLNRSSRQRVIRWEYRNEEFDGTLGAMAVAENRIYAISRTGCLLCIDRKWGHLNWMVSYEGSTRFPGIAIDGGRVYVPTDDSIWVYDDADVPRALLRYKFEYMPMGKPVVADNELFVTTSSYLWCLHLKK